MQKSFRTEVSPEELPEKADLSSRIMMTGSCFTENIGLKLQRSCFSTDINPCGIIYNPVSVYNTLEFLAGGEIFDTGNLVSSGGKWASIMHHGDFSSPRKDECLEKINKRASASSAFLRETDFLIITWGTSYVFEHIEKGQVVSNCHRLPGSAFRRYRVRSDEIVSMYTGLTEKLRSIRPSMKFIITVSPVRHWRDGAEENQLSKAELLLAASELKEQVKGLYYFPSYEIMMDDLRDYRFYGRDMLHPSDQAVDYIWDKFMESCIDKKDHQLMARIEKINMALDHRPLAPDGEAYREFLRKTEHEINEICGLRPEMNQNYLRIRLAEKKAAL